MGRAEVVIMSCARMAHHRWALEQAVGIALIDPSQPAIGAGKSATFNANSGFSLSAQAQPPHHLLSNGQAPSWLSCGRGKRSRTSFIFSRSMTAARRRAHSFGSRKSLASSPNFSMSPSSFIGFPRAPSGVRVGSLCGRVGRVGIEVRRAQP
jgi:hypothetical protein